MFKLFHGEARWYDLHTPPDHYFRDHELVLSLASDHGPDAHLLDIGCGTGVLLEKAHKAGVRAEGFDASSEMIALARTRVPAAAAWVQRMQGMDVPQRYDLVVSLSWCVHYCESAAELRDVISRSHRALRSRGRILLQVAHSPNLADDWTEDRAIGPSGTEDDISMRFRFRKYEEDADSLLADYSFSCLSTGDAFSETHLLRFVNVNLFLKLLTEVGFSDIEVWNSWRRDPWKDSGNVFVTGIKSS